MPADTDVFPNAKARQGLLANRPVASSEYEGSVYLAFDVLGGTSGVLYLCSDDGGGGYVWTIYEPVQYQFGTLANRPVAGALNAGGAYYATDLQQLYTSVQTSVGLPNTYAWITIPGATNASYLTQVNWFVNFTTGSDVNDGSQAAVGAGNVGPLKTVSEFFRRVAWPSAINVAMVLNIGANAPNTDVIRAKIAIGPLGSLLVKGTGTTVLYTGAVTARTNIARATNVPPDMTDAALPAANSWTGFIGRGMRVRTTAGSNPGAVAWPAKDLGAKQARFSNWNVPSNNFFANVEVNVSVADAFVVEQLTTIQNMDLDVQLFDDAATTVLTFQDLAFTTRFALSNTSVSAPIVLFNGCDIGTSVVKGGSSYINCRFGPALSNQGPYIKTSGDFMTVAAGLIMGGCFINAGFWDLGVLSQGGGGFGGGVTVMGGQNALALNDIAAFDSTANGFEFRGPTNLTASFNNQNLWGSGNALFGARVRGGTVISAAALPGGCTVTGTSGNVGVGGEAGTAKTWGQMPFIASDIAAGAGTTLSGIVVF